MNQIPHFDIQIFVLAYPDISSFEINKDLEFMVVACDGIWDVMNNAEVVQFVRTRLQKKMEPEAVCFVC